MSPRIAKSAKEDAQLQRGRAQMPDTAAVKALDPVRGFKVAMDVNGLVEIELPIRSPAERMHHVVGVFSAEAREHDALLICLPVAIGIFEMQQFRALAYVSAAIPRNDCCRNEQP